MSLAYIVLNVVVIAAVAGLCYWLVTYLSPPEPVQKICVVVIVVLAVMALLSLLFPSIHVPIH